MTGRLSTHTRTKNVAKNVYLVILRSLDVNTKCVYVELKVKWHLQPGLLAVTGHDITDLTEQQRIMYTNFLYLESVCYSQIFPTQGSEPGVLHCSQILYNLNHRGISSSEKQNVITLWCESKSSFSPVWYSELLNN